MCWISWNTKKNNDLIRSTKLPITIENLDGDGFHIFTEIKMEGRLFRSLIDTGASKTVVSDELSAQLKKIEIFQQEDSLAKGIGDQVLKTEMAHLPKIRLGRFKMEGLIVGVMDLSHISVTYSSMGLEPFHVILGGDLLEHYQAVINYKKGWLKLHL
jgi:hypothetical protein